MADAAESNGLVSDFLSRAVGGGAGAVMQTIASTGHLETHPSHNECGPGITC